MVNGMQAYNLPFLSLDIHFGHIWEQCRPWSDPMFWINTVCLTLKAPITTTADDIHKFFSLFFRETKPSYFMGMLCLAVHSHETSSLIFWKDKTKKN